MLVSRLFSLEGCKLQIFVMSWNSKIQDDVLPYSLFSLLLYSLLKTCSHLMIYYFKNGLFMERIVLVVLLAI